jgi:hypothetical protein
MMKLVSRLFSKMRSFTTVSGSLKKEAVEENKSNK